MGKYLVLWEIDTTKTPSNRKDIAMGWAVLINMVKEDLKKGLMKDWGGFVGETKGYAIFECPHLEMTKTLLQYAPFVLFEVKEVGTADEAAEAIKGMK